MISILIHKPNKDLAFINELFEANKVVPVIDKCYTLNKIAEAFQHFGSGFAKGKVVITIASTQINQ